MIVVGGYLLVMIMTVFAPKEIVGLAYDLGGVTTSTVTVPLVTALGVGLARTIRGRNPLTDGFGLIALASLTPMIFVMGLGLFVHYECHGTLFRPFQVAPGHGQRRVTGARAAGVV